MATTAPPSVMPVAESEDDRSRGAALASNSQVQPIGLHSVTLLQLVQSGALKPGGIVSVTYEGQTMKGILQPNGTISYNNEVFTTCSAFSMTVKRRIQPSKQGDDGWTSCMYNGKQLAEYRRLFLEASVQDV